MGKHTPSTEELEVVIANLLDKSPKEALTAKEVRQQLQKENAGWKVPGERRVAKFMKKQNSCKKKKQTGIFRMFKGASSNRSLASSQTGSEQQESHPSKSDTSLSGSEKERKGGFKKSFARAITGKSKKSKPKSTYDKFEKNKQEEAENSVVKFISEIEESEKLVVDENIRGMPAHPRESTQPNYPVEPIQPDSSKEEQEVATAASSDGGDELLQKKLSVVNESEVYADDNDGKTDCCACEACVIM